ncbi:hypothetical protein MNB_SV-12-926 [hydrothermal vent metagenome]|uniref:RiboL-PSP-HEPN domain-containing protein n=1 Tax=hydrothermal vent metagenome TaxID=652676 RepID=A0A1W1C9E4_9ZZZZ
MRIDELREEMEIELTWRSDELRMFKNTSHFIIKEEIRKKYRKSLIVMLYAHFEGFSKTCFLTYIKYINSLKLKRIDVKDKPELIASSMNSVFKKYDDKDRKNDFFKRKSPNDKNIHSIYRKADLINEFQDYFNEILIIEDEVIDTESNLWSHVLAKSFYKLGMKHDLFKNSNKSIDTLVNLRNSIAHGSERRGIAEKQYDKLEKEIMTVMERLILILEREAKLLSQ